MIWTDSILFFSSFQTATTTTVIATQPTPTTTYVQPSSHRANETLPPLIFTLSLLFVCLICGNVAIIVCIIPALICAIVVSVDLMCSSGKEGGEGWPITTATECQALHKFLALHIYNKMNALVGYYSCLCTCVCVHVCGGRGLCTTHSLYPLVFCFTGAVHHCQ